LLIALAIVVGPVRALAFDGNQASGGDTKTQAPLPACHSHSNEDDKPITIGAHFEHFEKAVISCETPIIPAITSGGSQVITAHAGYSNTWQGYAHHYGDDLAGNVSGKFVERFALPALFHQDEGYFICGPTCNLTTRAKHVFEHLIWASSDDHSSQRQFNVSAIPGSLIMAVAANGYVPQAQRTASAMGWRALENLGGYVAADIYGEFHVVGDANNPVARFCKSVKLCTDH
jgi:hypothetical protein